MKRSTLETNEYDVYYGRYIDKVSSDTDLRQGFIASKPIVLEFFKSLPEEKWEFRYAEGKWSIKEVMQHLIDTERVFLHRTFRISRGDSTPLAGFDQNIYIDPSNASGKSVEDLLEEFETTRNFSISLLKSLRDQDLKHVGVASGNVMSGRAAAFSILGHEIWHMDIIKEKYLD